MPSEIASLANKGWSYCCGTLVEGLTGIIFAFLMNPESATAHIFCRIMLYMCMHNYIHTLLLEYIPCNIRYMQFNEYKYIFSLNKPFLENKLK